MNAMGLLTSATPQFCGAIVVLRPFSMSSSSGAP